MLVVEVFRRGRPRVIGHGALALWPRDQGAEIADLYVAPRWRGRGLGTALIRALEAEAARLGAQSVEIGAAESNPRARALYERLGYRVAHTLRVDLGRGEEEVAVLAKPIP